jgi:type II secretion system protein N
MALSLPNLGPRSRKILRYAGFAVLALVTFVFAFQMTFPFHRVKDKIVDALTEKYEVTIGSVERSIIPGKMYFKAISLRTRPAKDEVATTFYVEQLDVGIGLFALLRGTASVKLDAKIGPGHVKGTIAVAKSGTEIDIVGEALPSASLPVRELVGLPMSGKIGFAVLLDLPNEKSKSGRVAANWAKAEGAIALSCPSGCTVGDGKSKLKAKLKNRAQQAFAEGGIDFGKVTIDTLFANVTIKDGKLTVSRFDAKSTDGDLRVEFDVALNPDISSSTVTGCLRFKGSDALLKREAKTHAAISTTGAPLGPDNLFHIKLDGQLREVRRLGQVCTATGASPPSGTPPSGTTSETPARPNLTITPETPARPAGIPSPQTQNGVPPPPPQVTLPSTAVPPAAAPDVGSAAVPPAAPPPGGLDGEPPHGGAVVAPQGQIQPSSPSAPQ